KARTIGRPSCSVSRNSRFGDARSEKSGAATPALRIRVTPAALLVSPIVASRRRSSPGAFVLAHPVVEPDLAEPCIGVRNERALLDGDAVVAGVRVRDNFTRIAALAQGTPDEVIQAKCLGPADLDYAVRGRPQRRPAERHRRRRPPPWA